MALKLQEDPLISVIIMCYNRKNFLLKAIESILSQTINRDKIEIIVTKNFEHPSLDTVIDQNGILSILEGEVNIGGMICNAVNTAKGRYISFLDDDDIFYSQKIERIVKIIDSYPDLIYYHNAFNSIDDDGKPINDLKHVHPPSTIILDRNNLTILIRKAKLLSGDVNMSSVTLKKSVITTNNHLVKQITGLQDVFLFFLATATKGAMILDSAVLTGYRIHPSESHGDMSHLERYTSGLKAVTEKYLKSYELLMTVEGDQRKEVKYDYVTNKFRYNLMCSRSENKIRFRELIYLLFHINHAENKQNQIALIGLTLLHLVAPRRTSAIYMKRKLKFDTFQYRTNN